MHILGVVHRDLAPKNLLFAHGDWTRGTSVIAGNNSPERNNSRNSSPNHSPRVRGRRISNANQNGMTNDRLVVADFGLACFCLPHQRIQERAGTINYSAPEQLQLYSKQNGQVTQGYDNAVDVWAAGVIFFELLTGSLPFQSNSEQALTEKICRGDMSFANAQRAANRTIPVSDQAKQLLAQMLSIDPAIRITAEDALDHPWFTGRSAEDEQTSEQSGGGGWPADCTWNVHQGGYGRA
jgi:serine/threonine protein kinase